jgi:predicted dehydrogenase
MNPQDKPDLTRRQFLKGSSFASLMSLLGGVELRAAEPAPVSTAAKSHGPKIKCGVIGLGNWGRELVGTLARLPEASVAAMCDPYAAALRRSAKLVPEAKTSEDYRPILDDKEIKAVLVATPTHLHKEIVLAALQAGKHVYCEAPIAASVDDARAIALAAQNAVRVVFQSGLQVRSDPQRHFLLPFIRAGAMGQTAGARAQWHKKQSWRHASPSADREQAINWRLNRQVSTGLIGEIGVHQIDAVSWFLNGRPKSVTGFGSVLQWRDGREVPDTIQAVFEYPGGVNFFYDCTLANSFDSEYEMYYGSDAAVMIRENKAWMFKEVDSPLLGWEVYARKDVFYKETGIALVANATKLAAQGAQPVEGAPFSNPTLQYALESFLTNVSEISSGVEDFLATFANADQKSIGEHVATIPRQPAAGYQEGFEAAVLAIKANEAIVQGTKITLNPAWFQLT